MKWRFTAVLAALAIVLGASPARAQQQTGEIFGKVTDQSGAVLPGVTVTLTGPRSCSRRRPSRRKRASFQFPRLKSAPIA